MLAGSERTATAELYRVDPQMPEADVDGAPIELRVRPAGGSTWTVVDSDTLSASAQARCCSGRR